MRKFNRNRAITSTAAAVSILLSGGLAVAQDPVKKDQDHRANDMYKSESKMNHDTDTMNPGMEHKHANTKRDAHQLARAFGVNELDAIEDWKIVNNGEELGEIDRLGIDRASGELLAIVGLEGVIGVNMKEVAIPLKHLKKAGDESLATSMTKEQLQMKRDIDPWTGTYAQTVDKNGRE